MNATGCCMHDRLACNKLPKCLWQKERLRVQICWQPDDKHPRGSEWRGFACWYALPVGTKITQAQDTFSVSDDRNFHLLLWPVADEPTHIPLRRQFSC